MYSNFMFLHVDRLLCECNKNGNTETHTDSDEHPIAENATILSLVTVILVNETHNVGT